MQTNRYRHSALTVSLIGLAALASAMGVGRFGFTPVLPLMQAESGLSLSQAAWLAGSNYAGYLIGALACSAAPPAPRNAVRISLLAVAIFTLAMGATSAYGAWIALRFAAGVASAYVLVGVSAWALHTLAELGRSTWSGWVFAGVGLGIGAAGLVGLVAGVGGYGAGSAWLLLGTLSAAVAAIVWAPMQAGGSIPTSNTPRAARLSASNWQLIFWYGTFGFGYIIPATFLPAMARALVADPSVFGWIWPLFGATAAASTAIAALCLRRVTARNLWAAGLVVMAAGVLAPVLLPSVGSLLLSAMCVGGTFMVITMAGMQEAQRLAGAGAPRLMAAMTTAFALGQLAGPIIIGMAASHRAMGIAGPSVFAAALLLAGAWILRRPQPVVDSPELGHERKQA
ncbi:MAG TPA: YbfB/YjiJ family MFS transporter [Burkholderiaceae bacterium]|nr:YbfB/YjiJ family MFS transporter [Burkholderiaceae bacterium]